MEGVHRVGRITELSAEARAASTRYGIHRLAYLVAYHCAKRVRDSRWTCARGLWRSGPCGPVAPVARCGTVKLSTAALPMPEFVTLAGVPGAPVATVPTDTVSAAPFVPFVPFVPFAPLAPFVPLSASSAQFPPAPATSMAGSITAFALSAM